MNTNLEGNRVEQEDIDNIMHTVKHDRQPIRVVSMFYLHRIYQIVQKVCGGVCKCCKERKYVALTQKQIKQASRKFNKALDVTNLLKSVQKSDLIQQAMLTRDQKILTMFQKKTLLCDEDISESSDELEDLYRSTDENQERINTELSNTLQTMTNKDLSRLDCMLLKGFYTNCRASLGNPRIIPKKVLSDEFKEILEEAVDELKKAPEKIVQMSKS